MCVPGGRVQASCARRVAGGRCRSGCRIVGREVVAERLADLFRGQPVVSEFVAVGCRAGPVCARRPTPAPWRAPLGELQAELRSCRPRCSPDRFADRRRIRRRNGRRRTSSRKSIARPTPSAHHASCSAPSSSDPAVAAPAADVGDQAADRPQHLGRITMAPEEFRVRDTPRRTRRARTCAPVCAGATGSACSATAAV